MQVAQKMQEKLEKNLEITQLDIENQSDLHAGHKGSPGTGESHFHATIISPAFDGLGKIDRQRLVYRLLKEELAGPVHALSLVLKTPAEAHKT